MIELVWFKRDMRAADHAPLTQAVKASAGSRAILPLAVVESEYWQLPETSSRHYLFWRESLAELQAHGLPVCVRVGNVVDTLDALHADHDIRHLWSHEETGNAWTYERDKAVARWCRAHNIGWTQMPQFGVFRGPVNRDGWAKRWEAAMATPLLPKPANFQVLDVPSAPLPLPEELGLIDDPCPHRQPGGRKAGIKLLDSFLYSGRARKYQRAMSSPLEGADACSRLSTHLAYGTLSMREVVQRAYITLGTLDGAPPGQVTITKGSLRSFIARLHWHCHFIQKLETEPEIEWRDLHPAFRGARTDGVGHPHFEAWAHGRTGFPFIDACMRSLMATGWINFRMRAMLVAFASYQLWLDWRDTGARLAQLFTDYEPGIHWSQVQMQSGSTAINTPRMYNPVKQSHDQDPDGVFIKRWVPELAALNGRAVHEPWTMTPMEAASVGFALGQTYPERIVDHEKAARAAREKLTRIRSAGGFYSHQKAIYVKHGSRKTSRHTPAQGRAWKKAKASDAQMELDL